VVGCCEKGNEPSGSIKHEVSTQCQLLKDSVCFMESVDYYVVLLNLRAIFRFLLIWRTLHGHSTAYSLSQLFATIITFFFSVALPANSGPRPLIQFRNDFPQSVGPLGRVISPPQGSYVNTGEHKHRINAYTYQTFVP
jgi:hypothetical protein